MGVRSEESVRHGVDGPDHALVECAFCSRYVPPSFDPEQVTWVYASGRWFCPLHWRALRALEETVRGAGGLPVSESWTGRELEEASNAIESLGSRTTSARLEGRCLVAVVEVESDPAADPVEWLKLAESLRTEPFPFLGALLRLEWRVRIASGRE